MVGRGKLRSFNIEMPILNSIHDMRFTKEKSPRQSKIPCWGELELCSYVNRNVLPPVDLILDGGTMMCPKKSNYEKTICFENSKNAAREKNHTIISKCTNDPPINDVNVEMSLNHRLSTTINVNPCDEKISPKIKNLHENQPICDTTNLTSENEGLCTEKIVQRTTVIDELDCDNVFEEESGHISGSNLQGYVNCCFEHEEKNFHEEKTFHDESVIVNSVKASPDLDNNCANYIENDSHLRGSLSSSDPSSDGTVLCYSEYSTITGTENIQTKINPGIAMGDRNNNTQHDPLQNIEDPEILIAKIGQIFANKGGIPVYKPPCHGKKPCRVKAVYPHCQYHVGLTIPVSDDEVSFFFYQ